MNSSTLPTTFSTYLNNTRYWVMDLPYRMRDFISFRPGVAAIVLASIGVAAGAGARTGIGSVEVDQLQAQIAHQDTQFDEVRGQAQHEINAMAARLAELQAEANRLNALGERLTRIGQLEDGEFDFDKPVGVGGTGPVRDMKPGELHDGLDQLQAQLQSSGGQLTLLESLLFNRELDRNAVPSRMPIANTYITSGFGGRADPFGGGSQYHKGIDFKANVGDAVTAVADGVVSYSGVRSGYGQVIEIDHGNGYVTRYAHNSRLLLKVGDLARAGQTIAKAGSTGRSTGAHVHLEVWENGRVVNPRKFLGDQGIKRG